MLSSFTILCSENESKTKPVETKKEKFSVSEELVYEVKSKYSHIKVADYGTLTSSLLVLFMTVPGLALFFDRFRLPLSLVLAVVEWFIF